MNILCEHIATNSWQFFARTAKTASVGVKRAQVHGYEVTRIHLLPLHDQLPLNSHSHVTKAKSLM